MLPRLQRHLRENNPNYASFVLGGTHIRDVPCEEIERDCDRVIVSLPWSYNEKPDRSYPVVYLCDGFWDFPLVYGMYSHLLYDKVIPEFILVGLAYSGEKPDVDGLRKIDLGVPASEDLAPGDFLHRIKTRIIPFIETEYAADPSYRVIAGCSIGGAFTLGVLLRAPGLFNGAIALAPTVKNSDRWLFEREKKFAAEGLSVLDKLSGKRKQFPVRLFLGVGGADAPEILQGIQAFNAQLDQRRYRQFEKQFRIIDGEKHGALKPEGFNRGLRYVFAQDFDLPR